jgi:hypothetical protein
MFAISPALQSSTVTRYRLIATARLPLTNSCTKKQESTDQKKKTREQWIEMAEWLYLHGCKFIGWMAKLHPLANIRSSNMKAILHEANGMCN